MKLIIKNKNEMIDLAKEIAKSCKIGDVIGLKGTLGAGKSFFAAAFINSLADKKITVPSPTFNLVLSYPTAIGPIYHFDLYRIKDPEELYNIGIEDALTQGVSLIEWPEIGRNFYKNYREINIEIGEGEERIITFAS